MKILVTGSNGFIAQHIVFRLLENTGYHIIATSKNEDKLRWSMSPDRYEYHILDVYNKEFYKILKKINPEIIIHTAAIGSADECELNKSLAYRVNVEGTKGLVDFAKRTGTRMLFLSTDFVFDGKKGTSYIEDDVTGPVNYYGETKVLGEEYITQQLSDFCIVRLCAVYGDAFYGNARGIITLTEQKLKEGKSINVVGDQFRTPTYVGDIADAVVEVIRHTSKGIYHVSGNEVYTPYEMAVTAAKFFDLDANLINKVASTSIKESAERPKYTGFIIDKAIKDLGFKPTILIDGIERMKREKNK